MIQADKISKSFGSVTAVNNVSIDVQKGETLVIRGASGSGKTTLLRMLAGLVRPDQGKISLSGEIVSTREWLIPPIKRCTGFVFQTPSLWPHLTVYENIAFGLDKQSRQKIHKRVEELTECLQIHALLNRYPQQLSGGEARRVAIARTLAPQPAVLLLDEPLVHLDPDLKGKVMNVIKSEAAQFHAAVIVVTHDENGASLWEGTIKHMSAGYLDLGSAI